MKIKHRVTHSLAQINVDELETYLYKSDPDDVQQFIWMLIDVAESIATLTNKTLHDHMREYYHI